MTEAVLRDRKYPKINSLYKRERKTKRLIIGDLSMPEFSCIQEWDLYEKIDGTNIRIIIDNDTVEFRGRTNSDDNIPAHLLEHLKNRYTMDKLTPFLGKQAIIFGEGFGYKIQNGGAYVNGDPVVKFHAFDVLLYNTWMQQDDMRGLLKTIDIECAQYIGSVETTNFETPAFIGLRSMINMDAVMEGVIARPVREMLTAHGDRVMWKLKHKDFK